MRPSVGAAGVVRRFHISHSVAAVASVRKGIEPRLTACQPLLFSSNPDDIEEIAMVAKTMKSFAAWVLARSDGV